MNMQLSIVIFILITFAVYCKSDECIETYLTELTPIDMSDNYHDKLWVNEWPKDSSNEIFTSLKMGDGYYYNEFVVLHPQTDQQFSYVVYDLNGDNDTFSAVIGMENNNLCVAQNTDGVQYKFYLDNEIVYESPILIQHEYKNVNIDVRNANELKIEIYQNGNIWCDHATIANPILRTCEETIACESAEWQLVYQHDPLGFVMFGDINELITDVQNGKDIRVTGDCIGDCSWAFTSPSRVWTMPIGRVYIFADNTVSMGWDSNGDPYAYENRLYNTVFDTSGKGTSYRYEDGEPGKLVPGTPFRYGAKWFTRG